MEKEKGEVLLTTDGRLIVDFVERNEILICSKKETDEIRELLE